VVSIVGPPPRCPRYPPAPARPLSPRGREGALGLRRHAPAAAAEPAVGSPARHLCWTAGQACGPAHGIRSPGDVCRRLHPAGVLPRGGGSGTCAGWPRPRFVVVVMAIRPAFGIIMPRRPNDTLQTERYRRRGQLQYRSAARPCACICIRAASATSGPESMWERRGAPESAIERRAVGL
jgi:hypothetical protein